MKNAANRTINERRIRPSDPARREPLERRAGYVSDLVAHTEAAIQYLIPDIDSLPEVTGIIPEAASAVPDEAPKLTETTAYHIAQSVLGGDGAAVIGNPAAEPALSQGQRIENAMRAVYEVQNDSNRQEGSNVAA